jgi:hypothetical protein
LPAEPSVGLGSASGSWSTVPGTSTWSTTATASRTSEDAWSGGRDQRWGS